MAYASKSRRLAALAQARKGVPLVRVYDCTLCHHRHEEGATVFYVKHLSWRRTDGINLEVKS